MCVRNDVRVRAAGNFLNQFPSLLGSLAASGKKAVVLVRAPVAAAAAAADLCLRVPCVCLCVRACAWDPIPSGRDTLSGSARYRLSTRERSRCGARGSCARSSDRRARRSPARTLQLPHLGYNQRLFVRACEVVRYFWGRGGALSPPDGPRRLFPREAVKKKGQRTRKETTPGRRKKVAETQWSTVERERRMTGQSGPTRWTPARSLIERATRLVYAEIGSALKCAEPACSRSRPRSGRGSSFH